MTRGAIFLVLALLLAVSAAAGQVPAPPTVPTADETGIGEALPDLGDTSGVATMLKWTAMITVLSLAPAIAVLVTCFTRIIVVLGLLRQALSAQQLPPNSILFGLALLMTAVIMAPVYRNVHRDAWAPYLDGTISSSQALDAASVHVRGFMIRQMEHQGNAEDVYPFLDDELVAEDDLTWSQVPTVSLIPGFVVSELKVAFYIGFRIYLPFLIIDMLVASILVSMGMIMLPPVLISLPFKLLLFVLADGWHLVTETLMKSFS